MDPILRELLVIVFLGFLAAALYLFVAYSNKDIKKNFKALNASIDVKTLKERWCQVRQLLTSNNDSNLSRAVLEGDKLFDEGLKLSGAIGSTMADRLKSCKEKFDKQLYSDIWEAHKLRNYYAHDVNAHINKNQAQEALIAFEEGLKVLGKL
jgi:hypothetical protein